MATAGATDCEADGTDADLSGTLVWVGFVVSIFGQLVLGRPARGRLAELLYIAPHRPSKAASGYPAGLQSRKPYPHSRILTPI